MSTKKVKINSSVKMKGTKNKIKTLKEKENTEPTLDMLNEEDSAEILDDMTDEQFENLSSVNEDTNNEPLVKWHPVAQTEKRKPNKNMFAKFGEIFGF